MKTSYRKLRKLAEVEAKGQSLLFWRDCDGLIDVGERDRTRKLTQEQFDEFVEREVPANAEIFILSWKKSEEILPDGSGQISMFEERENYDRRHCSHG